MTPELSVVVPSYNEAGNIPGLLERFRDVARGIPLELIVVDNGSGDGTGDILRAELSRPENRFARSVRVERNIGYGHGLKTGLLASRAATLAITHADLQCPPDDVARAYRIYSRARAGGPCLVKGRRSGRPAADRLVTWFYNRISAAVLGLRAWDAEGARRGPPDVNAEPKVFDRSLLDRLAAAPSDFTFDLYLLHCARRAGARIVEFDAVYLPRAWGRSKLAANPWVRLKTSLNALRRVIEFRLGANG